MARIMEEIESRNLQSEGEIQAFLETFTGRSLDDMPKRTDKKSRSQDLVYEAYEASATQGKKWARQALELDADNAGAYVYLAERERQLEKAKALYEKAIAVSEKTLGKRFFEEQPYAHILGHYGREYGALNRT